MPSLNSSNSFASLRNRCTSPRNRASSDVPFSPTILFVSITFNRLTASSRSRCNSSICAAIGASCCSSATARSRIVEARCAS